MAIILIQTRIKEQEQNLSYQLRPSSLFTSALNLFLSDRELDFL